MDVGNDIHDENFFVIRIFQLGLNYKKDNIVSCYYRDRIAVIAFFDGEDLWQGSVDAPGLARFAEELGLAFAEYLDITKKAFSQALSPLDAQFEFELRDVGTDHMACEITWKKLVDESGFKIIYGSAMLLKQTNKAELVMQLFSTAISELNSLRSSYKDVTAELERMTQERENALRIAADCVNIKEETETKLFSKFVPVLNEKKAKIRELQSKVDELSAKIPAPSEAADEDPTSEQTINLDARKHSTDSDSDATTTDGDGNNFQATRLSAVLQSEQTSDEESQSQDLGNLLADKPRRGRPRGRGRGRRSRRGMNRKQIVKKDVQPLYLDADSDDDEKQDFTLCTPSKVSKQSSDTTALEVHVPETQPTGEGENGLGNSQSSVTRRSSRRLKKPISEGDTVCTDDLLKDV